MKKAKEYELITPSMRKSQRRELLKFAISVLVILGIAIGGQLLVPAAVSLLF